MTNYQVKTSLEDRDAINGLPNRSVSGVLLIGDVSIGFETNHSSYGHDYTTVTPAVHNGNHCFIRRDEWCPAFGYSGSGSQETIISIPDGVELLLAHGVFNDLFDQIPCQDECYDTSCPELIPASKK